MTYLRGISYMMPGQVLPKKLLEGKCTVTPRYNAVVGRHLLGPPYTRGTLWDPVDWFDIVIPRAQAKDQGTQRPKAWSCS